MNFIKVVSLCWMTLLFYRWEDPDLPSIPFKVCFDFHIL